MNFTKKNNFNKASRNDIIEHLCEKCNNKCEHRINNFVDKIPLCKTCSYSERSKKAKATCLLKYGVKHTSQLDNTKEKHKKTCIEKYGYNHPCKSNFVKDKIKQGCLSKYGVEFPLQSTEIKEKWKKTCLKKYNFTCSLSSNIIKEKIKKTCLSKYGTEYAIQATEIKDKVKKTCLSKYGTEYAIQATEIKDKAKSTIQKNYGVEYIMQNPHISEKQLIKCFKSKIYILPSGKKITIQGYENFALDYLINIENLSENEIITSRKEVPECWYYNETRNKLSRYYVDIYIPSQNRCIEVKSTWTYKQISKNIYPKLYAIKKLGYTSELWIYDEKSKSWQCEIV